MTPAFFTIAFTAYQTLLFVNAAIKYYDQLEVIPIYQTNVAIWSIIVGMFSLDEIRYYSFIDLALIIFGAVLCTLGATFLMRKPKERGYEEL